MNKALLLLVLIASAQLARCGILGKHREEVKSVSAALASRNVSITSVLDRRRGDFTFPEVCDCLGLGNSLELIN